MPPRIHTLRLPTLGLNPAHRTLILISALIVLVFSGTLIHNANDSAEQDRSHHTEQAETLAKLYARVLFEPTLRRKQRIAQEHIDALVDTGIARHIQVTLPSGEIFAQTGSPVSSASDAITATAPVVKQGETIGNVALTIPITNVALERAHRVREAYIEFFLLFAVVLVGVLIAFRQLLRPLARISTQILRLADGDHEIEIPKTRGNDEIARVWKAIEIFRDNARERDRTEAVLAQRARELTEAQQVLWEAVECSAEGFALWDTDAKLLMSNSKYREMLPELTDFLAPGLAYEEYARLAFESGMLAIPDGSTMKSAIDAMTGRHMRAENTRETMMGDDRWIRTSKRNTDTGRVVTILSDVTERKRAEEVLRTAEERYRSLFEQSPIAMLIQDGEKILFANPAAAEMYGTESADDLVGTSVIELLHPDFHEGWRQRLDQILAEGNTGGLVEQIRLRRDGSEIYVAAKGIPVEWQGSPAILGVNIDITERKKNEQALRENEERYRSLFEAAPVAMMIQDEETIVFANPAAAALYGAKNASTLTGLEAIELVSPDERNPWRIRRRHLWEKREETPLVEQRRLTLDGREIIVASKGIPIEWKGEPAVLGVTLDVTENRKTEAELALRADELAETREVLWDAVANISEGFALWDTDEKLLICNENYRSLFSDVGGMLVPGVKFGAFTREALRRGIIAADDGTNPEDTLAKFMDRHRNPGPPAEQLLGNGEWVRVSKTVTKTGRVVSIISKITESKLAEATIRQMALHDALTGLPNRSEFQRRLGEAIETANRTDHIVGIMLLDLDNFKTVNDTLGHPVGDELLKLAAARINECVRRSDMVARLGGDEFAVIVTNTDSVDGIVGLAQRIVNVLAQPFRISGSDIHTGTSIGITVYPNDYGDTDELLRNADVALYKAKEDGRGICRLYDETMNQAVIQRQLMEVDLRSAIENQEFHLRYQPQLDIATGRVIGAEALIRWIQPNGESISPADFIPVAEATHLILPIGEWVLDEACAQMRRWRDKGVPSVSVSVNISPRQFRQSDLMEQVENALQKYNLEPDCLELEITEGMAMSGGEDMLSILNRLNALGVKLAIDDFGQGYSSLAYLKRFPVDRLKIDKSFVDDITTDWDDAAICSAIIQLGHNLQLKVIAEGVETLDQAAHLIDKDCDEVQGYLFGAPMTADDFELFMRMYDPHDLQRKLSVAEPVPDLKAAI